MTAALDFLIAHGGAAVFWGLSLIAVASAVMVVASKVAVVVMARKLAARHRRRRQWTAFS